MTATQAEQLAQSALQAPLNTLVVFVALFAFVIVFGVGFLVWKFVPVILRQIQQQLETNRKLTDIVEQNSEQSKLAMQSVRDNTSEMTRQTTAIEQQTIEIKTQSADLRNYQVLVSDNLSAHTDQLTENTETLKANTKSIIANTETIQTIKDSIELLSNQIQSLLEDKDACKGATDIINNLRADVLAFITEQQTKRITGENNSVQA